jgi:hypothetical protein
VIVFTEPIRDFDFHPDEPDVRLFTMPRRGVRRIDDRVFVAEVRYGDIVMRHYAFADRWFKINITTNLEGDLVETGPERDVRQFAFNCDIATPMQADGNAVYAVDLFLDVLVRRDARTWAAYDEEEFEEAVRRALISPAEASGARHGLTELVELIEHGYLMAFLASVWPFGHSVAPPALPERRISLSEVPQVHRKVRATWAPFLLPSN